MPQPERVPAHPPSPRRLTPRQPPRQRATAARVAGPAASETADPAAAVARLRPPAPTLCSGGELRQLRQSRGLLQRELAELLGYSVQTISSWEIGRRTIPASIAVHLYDVLDDVTTHLRAQRARFLDVLHTAWAG